MGSESHPRTNYFDATTGSAGLNLYDLDQAMHQIIFPQQEQGKPEKIITINQLEIAMRSAGALALSERGLDSPLVLRTHTIPDGSDLKGGAYWELRSGINKSTGFIDNVLMRITFGKAEPHAQAPWNFSAEVYTGSVDQNIIENSPAITKHILSINEPFKIIEAPLLDELRKQLNTDLHKFESFREISGYSLTDPSFSTETTESTNLNIEILSKEIIEGLLFGDNLKLRDLLDPNGILFDKKIWWEKNFFIFPHLRIPIPAQTTNYIKTCYALSNSASALSQNPEEKIPTNTIILDTLLQNSPSILASTIELINNGLNKKISQKDFIKLLERNGFQKTEINGGFLYWLPQQRNNKGDITGNIWYAFAKNPRTGMMNTLLATRVVNTTERDCYLNIIAGEEENNTSPISFLANLNRKILPPDTKGLHIKHYIDSLKPDNTTESLNEKLQENPNQLDIFDFMLGTGYNPKTTSTFDIASALEQALGESVPRAQINNAISPATTNRAREIITYRNDLMTHLFGISQEKIEKIRKSLAW